ncbi:ubiquitin-conjugating enzyme [Planoprotostelium fungivorum]|uniref:E2 ubiquitin-conjugating enzyme n=1 Tax=Planoprotostelium fungivorum TaxID=1890364 RepID=A0A2P6MXV1_9EUKA|nr:ubiquitin-conjugating enzyme [Planoprotostelium fungivorum]
METKQCIVRPTISSPLTYCQTRLKRELHMILKEPIPNIVALPNPKNILEWHYVITGPTDTPYEGGTYHGKVVFPTGYPHKPPAIYMITPNGRFEINKRLCLSMSDYHPESWNPLWSVSTILNGLLSFMLEDADTLGSVRTTTDQKRKYAQNSSKINAANPMFRKLFPELVESVAEGESLREGREKEKEGQGVLLREQKGGRTGMGFLLIMAFVVLALIINKITNQKQMMDQDAFNLRLGHLLTKLEEMQRVDGAPLITDEARYKMNVSPSEGIKDMNLTGSYLRNRTNFRNQRELIQNFVDQCRHLNGNRDPRLTYEQVPSNLDVADGINVWRLFNQDAKVCLILKPLLGSLFEAVVASVPIYTVMTNFSTVLDPVILAVGHSEKGEGAAGHFGEGMKVAINCLTDAGYLVEYCTGCTKWTFSHNKNQILHVHFSRIEPKPHTVVTIRIPYHVVQRGDTMKAIDINEHLTLNPYYQLASPHFDSDQNILFLQIEKFAPFLNPSFNANGPEQMAGGIYIRGIRVMKSPHGSAVGNSMGFAINYIGSSNLYKELGLGRDRDHLMSDRIIGQMITKLLTVSFAGNSRAQDSMCQFILKHVGAQPKDQSSEFVEAMKKYGGTPFADTLCMELKTDSPILPYKEEQKDMKEEAEYLQFKTHLVCDGVYNLMRTSRHMVTLDRLWEIKRKDLSRPSNAVEKQIHQSLVDTLDKCFSTSPSAKLSLTFKIFPPGNCLLVIDIPHTDEQGRAIQGKQPKEWIIDARFLSRSQMHQWLKEKNISKCISNSCQCIKTSIVNAFLRIMGKRGVNADVLLVSLLNRTIQESPTPAEINPSPITTVEMAPGNAVQAEQRHETVGPIHLAQQEQLLFNTLFNIHNNNDAFEIQNVGSQHSSQKDWIQGREGIYCERKDLQGQMELSKCTKTCIDNFREVISSLTLLFNYPQHKVHCFYEDKETIAFNHNTHLFFNLRYYQVLQPNESYDRVKCWWLVTFAHEVAHNVVTGHNKHHEFVEEQ